MRKLSRAPVVGAILLVLLIGATGSVAGRAGSTRDPQATAAQAVARNPLAFQPEGTSRFVARTPRFGVALSPDGATVSGYFPAQAHPAQGAARAQAGTPLRLRLDDANPTAGATPRDPQSGRANVFIGDDPSAWRTDVTTYGQVAYSDVWDGIDVVWHGNGSHLEQDFVVAPGADPKRIGLSFPDAHSVAIGNGGDLVVQLPDGEAHLAAPTLYQDVGSRRHKVPGTFVLRAGGVAGFAVGAHDTSRPLVIDPVLVESTFLGGAGSDAAYGVAVDAGGNVYVTGSTESVDFPVAGSVQNTLMQVNEVRTDAFIAKIKADGSGFAYSTFLGGKGRDVGYGIAVAFDGSAYVSGSTESTDFPTARPVQKAYGGGTTDAFVTKLGPQGAVLAYSTYLGGGGNDIARGVAVDGAGNAYVVGSTNSNDFPTAGPPLQGAPNRPDDVAGFVTSLNVAGSAWNYSTYLGGSGDDRAMAVAVDPAGEAFVTGDTRSADFPLMRPIQANPGSPLGTGAAKAEGFLLKLPAAGSPLVYSTYLGGAGSDLATGVAIDLGGAAYVTGTTDSLNFPVVKALQNARGGGFDAFVSKVDPNGSALVYSTYLGGSASDAGAGITVTADDQASVTGTSASDNFPVAKALNGTKAGFVDAFVATLTSSGGGLVQSTYLGGRDDDNATAIAADRSGSLYVAGFTRSADFPLVSPLRSVTGGTDAFVSTVGDSPTGSSAGVGAPARERRIRIFGVVTAVLFLAAIAQTLWLRRRGTPDVADPAPAIPGIVAIPSASRVEPAWYTPKAPRLSELPTSRPAPVPAPARRRAPKRPVPALGSGGPAAGDHAGGDLTGGDMAVPDLLPPGPDVDWSGDREPDDADFWLTDDKISDEGAPRSVDVQAPDLWAPAEPDEVVAGGPWGTGSEGPVDVQAPDLWGPAESDEDLAIDPMWAELLTGPAPGPVPSFAPPDSPASPDSPAGPEVADPAVSEADPVGSEADGSLSPSGDTSPPPLTGPKRRPSKAASRTSGRRPRTSEEPSSKTEPVPAEAEDTPSVPPPPPLVTKPESSSEPAGSPSKPRRRQRSQAGPTETAPPQPDPSGDATTERDWIAELWPEKPLKAEDAKATLGDVDPSPESMGSSDDVPADNVEATPRGWRARRRANAAKRQRGEAEPAGVPQTVAEEEPPTVAPPARPDPSPPRRRGRPATAPVPGPPSNQPAPDRAATPDQAATPDRAATRDEPAAPDQAPVVPVAAGSPPRRRRPTTAPVPTGTPDQTPSQDEAGSAPPPSSPARRQRPAPPPSPIPDQTPAPVAALDQAPDSAAVVDQTSDPAASAPAPRRRSPTSPAVPVPEPVKDPAPAWSRRLRQRPDERPAVPSRNVAAPSPHATDPPPAAPAPVASEAVPSAPSELARPVPEPVELRRRKPASEPPGDGGDPAWASLVADALQAAPVKPDREGLVPEPGVVPVSSVPTISDEDREAVEAGLTDLVGNVELDDLPASAVAGTPDDQRGVAPLDDPAFADALAIELSIGDLLAEDLPIPESAIDRHELSLRELLAEDLIVPDTEPARAPDAPTSVPETPSAGRIVSVGTDRASGADRPGHDDAGAPPDKATPASPPTRPEDGAEAGASREAPDDHDPDPGAPPDEPPQEPRYRQLPEAKPGIMRGLRAGWNRPHQ